MSNTYAIKKGQSNFNLTFDKVRVFLGILLVSGYATVPRLKIYCEQLADCYNKAISESVSWNRFT